MNNISEYKTKINKCRGKLESFEARKKAISKSLIDLNNYQISLEEAQVFIQVVARETQEQLKFHLTDIVNLCIATCFPDIVFDIDFDVKNNRTVAQLVYKTNGYNVDPMDASGGGLCDLTAFALRIALYNIGHTDNVIIFDEPLKWLQPKELQVEAFKVMKELSDKMNIQFILVANSVGSENIIEIADRVFEVKLKKELIGDKTYDVSKVIVKE
jgi:hypothetical protein